MSESLPEFQWNEWSCALACFVWMARRSGIHHNQKDFIEANHAKFLGWQPYETPGALSRGQLSDLVQWQYETRDVLWTKCFKIFDETVKRNAASGLACVGGFIYSKQPTNHAVIIVGTSNGQVQTMDPDNQIGYRLDSWEYWTDERDSDYLAFFVDNSQPLS